jgi:NAD(P)-dependent dehydrogenase (short-subunit alcohol dehydrogenase family)
MSTREVAVVVGAGPGLGNALVGRFAEAGMRVAAISRKGLVGKAHRDLIRGYSCDATVDEQVRKVFERVADELGPPPWSSSMSASGIREAFWRFLRSCSSRPGAPVALPDFWSVGLQRRPC